MWVKQNTIKGRNGTTHAKMANCKPGQLKMLVSDHMIREIDNKEATVNNGGLEHPGWIGTYDENVFQSH